MIVTVIAVFKVAYYHMKIMHKPNFVILIQWWMGLMFVLYLKVKQLLSNYRQSWNWQIS